MRSFKKGAQIGFLMGFMGCIGCRLLDFEHRHSNLQASRLTKLCWLPKNLPKPLVSSAFRSTKTDAPSVPNLKPRRVSTAKHTQPSFLRRGLPDLGSSLEERRSSLETAPSLYLRLLPCQPQDDGRERIVDVAAPYDE
jgi:hypothetical protein